MGGRNGFDLNHAAEVVASALNVYRYLLLRDRATNYTGIWLPAQIKELRNSLIDPVHRCLREQYAKPRKSVGGGDSASDWAVKARQNGMISVDMGIGDQGQSAPEADNNDDSDPSGPDGSGGDALAAQGLFLV